MYFESEPAGQVSAFAMPCLEVPAGPVAMKIGGKQTRNFLDNLGAMPVSSTSLHRKLA